MLETSNDEPKPLTDKEKLVNNVDKSQILRDNISKSLVVCYARNHMQRWTCNPVIQDILMISSGFTYGNTYDTSYTFAGATTSSI